MEAFVVSIRNTSASGKEGLLHPLVKHWQAGRCSFAVFSLPAVMATIKFKWQAFARRLLFVELGMYCLWLGSFYIFTAAMQD